MNKAKIYPVLAIVFGLIVLIAVWFVKVKPANTPSTSSTADNTYNAKCVKTPKFCPDGSYVIQAGRSCKYTPCPDIGGALPDITIPWLTMRQVYSPFGATLAKFEWPINIVDAIGTPAAAGATQSYTITALVNPAPGDLESSFTTGYASGQYSVASRRDVTLTNQPAIQAIVRSTNFPDGGYEVHTFTVISGQAIVLIVRPEETINEPSAMSEASAIMDGLRGVVKIVPHGTKS